MGPAMNCLEKAAMNRSTLKIANRPGGMCLDRPADVPKLVSRFPIPSARLRANMLTEPHFEYHAL